MPKYDYICNKGHKFSIYQSIKAKPLKTCIQDKCRYKVKKLIGNTSFALKGGGWYKDGY